MIKTASSCLGAGKKMSPGAMNRPGLYYKSFKPFGHVYKEIINEFGNKLQWNNRGKDSLLDIGCGPGNVTRDVLVPLMPNNFSHVVGADYSEDMLRYARQHFQHPRIMYRFLDISGDISDTKLGQFDHVTSFNCLHWVDDLGKAFKNIHSLLHPGGDCILAFIYRGLIFDVFNEMSKTNKWSQYFSKSEKILPTLHHSEDPIGECQAHLEAAGFQNFNVQLKRRVTQTTRENYRDMMHSIDTFFERIPENLREEYLRDEMEQSRKMWKKFAAKSDETFPVYYSQIVCYAQKNDEHFSDGDVD